MYEYVNFITDILTALFIALAVMGSLLGLYHIVRAMTAPEPDNITLLSQTLDFVSRARFKRLNSNWYAFAIDKPSVRYYPSNPNGDILHITPPYHQYLTLVIGVDDARRLVDRVRRDTRYGERRGSLRIALTKKEKQLAEQIVVAIQRSIEKNE